jgi:hypothetical protein
VARNNRGLVSPRNGALNFTFAEVEKAIRIDPEIFDVTRTQNPRR